MIAFAEKTRNMTDDEILDMATRVDRLRTRGWSMQQLSDELDYAGPSSLYTACRELCGIEIERYRRLCRLDADGREPPSPVRRNGKPVMIPEERVDHFVEVVRTLQADGLTQGEQAKLAGYGSGAGLSMAVRTRRIPVEVYDRLVELARDRELIAGPTELPDFPARDSRGTWTALEYFDHLSRHLERCADLVEEAQRELSNPLTRPGYDHFRDRLRDLAESARQVGA